MKLRLVRTLPAYAPRPAFERTDAHVDAVLAVTFVPGTREVIAISRWGIQRFALEHDEPVWRVPTSARWSAGIAVSPDGERLLTICDDARLVERDAYTGAERWCWAEGCHHTRTLAFSADSSEVLWCGDGVASNPGGFGYPAVVLYDVATQAPRWRWHGEDWRSARGAALIPSGVLVFLFESKRAIHLRRDSGAVDPKQRRSAAHETAFAHELSGIDRAGRVIAVAPFRQPQFEVITKQGGAMLELADPDLDSVTGLACTDDLVAVGTNGGHTYVYEIGR